MYINKHGLLHSKPDIVFESQFCSLRIACLAPVAVAFARTFILNATIAFHTCQDSCDVWHQTDDQWNWCSCCQVMWTSNNLELWNDACLKQFNSSSSLRLLSIYSSYRLWQHIEGILPKGLYLPDRALLAGYHRYVAYIWLLTSVRRWNHCPLSKMATIYRMRC